MNASYTPATNVTTLPEDASWHQRFHEERHAQQRALLLWLEQTELILLSGSALIGLIAIKPGEHTILTFIIAWFILMLYIAPRVWVELDAEVYAWKQCKRNHQPFSMFGE